jgi:uncharacterized protein (DUF2235 family)
MGSRAIMTQQPAQVWHFAFRMLYLSPQFASTNRDGIGIHGDIQDAYHFLCLNYQPGDEIHLIGFSRGAFTVRCLACFINDFGILRVTRLATLRLAYKLWQGQGQELVKLGEYAETWKKENHVHVDIRIETCAVWDTVRSLFNIQAATKDGLSSSLAFVEKKVPSRLQYAFQALALHETRQLFNPVLWDASSAGTTTVRETWFAGDHSDIGGGHADSGLATISLLWMISQFKEFTNAAFRDVMVLDYMTPMFLYCKKDEYFLMPHTYNYGEPRTQLYCSSR